MQRERARPWDAALRYLLILAGGVSVVAAILLSPYLLSVIASGEGNWTTIGNVGQAYGGVSAVLSGLALIGVAGSLGLQRRQIAADRGYRDRERHFELIRIAMAEPDLLGVVEPRIAGDPEARRLAYVNLWISFWENSWINGGLTELGLRRMVAAMFEDETTAQWWLRVGSNWGTLEHSKRSRMFVGVVNSEARARLARASSVRNDRSATADQPPTDRGGPGQAGPNSVVGPPELGDPTDPEATGSAV
jgi:Family of unknown function (DUF6082)